MRNSPESKLLQPCRGWLDCYLRTAHPRSVITIFPNSEQKQLRAVLNDAGFSQFFPESSAWEVKVDVVAVVQMRKQVRLVFVELKATPISLVNVGQLLGYCRVCRPSEAFLLSSMGISGDLKRLLTIYGRLDVLNFGENTIQLGNWDSARNQPDWSSLIPGGLLPSI